jgi:MFS family permease
MYAFGVFSDLLKVHFGMTQTQLDTVGLVSNIGGNLGVHVGYFYDKFGPKATIALGGLQGVFGFGMMWACVQYSIPAPYWFLLVLAFIQGHSQAWTDIASVPLLADSFPNHRGSAIGFGKAFVGLSGAVFAQLYTALYKPDTLGFVLMSAVVFGLLAVLGFVFMNRTHLLSPDGTEPWEDTSQTDAWFRTVYKFVYAIIALMLAAAMSSQLFELSQADELGITAVIFGAFMALHVYLNTRHEGDKGSERGAGGEDAASLKKEQAVREPLLSTAGYADKELEGVGDCDPAAAAAASPHASRGGGGDAFTDAVAVVGTAEDLSLLQSLRTWSFWLLFFVMTVGCGSGLVVINNIGQMVKAQRRDAGETDTIVSLISVCSSSGRLGFGGLSDWGATRGWGRAYFLGAALACMVLSHGLLALDAAGTLYPACGLCGLSYGAQCCLAAAVCSDLFGMRYFGAVYAASSVALAVGSFALASGLTAHNYEKHVARAPSVGPGSGGSHASYGSYVGTGNDCYGTACFQATYQTCCGLCAVAFCVCFLLARQAPKRQPQPGGAQAST